SGKPCARLIAPYSFETRVISRITDSVKVLARCAVAARRETVSLAVTLLTPSPLRLHFDYAACSASDPESRSGLGDVVIANHRDVVGGDVSQAREIAVR